MNANERRIIEAIADNLEEGKAIRGHYYLLHTGTQETLRQQVPNLLEKIYPDELATVANQLREIAESEQS